VNDDAVSSIQELVTRDRQALPIWKEYLTHIPGHLVRAAVHPSPEARPNSGRTTNKTCGSYNSAPLRKFPRPHSP
jgi:hypothetical protein